MDIDEQTDERRVRVQFTTKHPDYVVDVPSIAVPVKLGRFGLSEIVNHLLDKADDPTPFNFVHVNSNKIVRDSLEKFMQRESLIVEDVLKLEYVPAVRQPEQGGGLPVDDWISSISSCTVESSNSTFVVAGGFDGSIEVAKLTNRQEVTTITTTHEAHKESIKSISVLGNISEDSNSITFVTGANDGVVKVWQFDSNSETVRESARCVGHGGCVASVASSRDSNTLVASGGWDNMIYLWDLLESKDDGDEAPIKKQRGVENTSVRQHEPLGVFEGHSDNVSAVCWGSGPEVGNKLFSGSWDYTIRVWDLEKQTSVSVYNGNKVISCLDHSYSGQLLASGHPDHIVRVWDARAGGDSVVKLKLESHKGWVTSVKWNPTKPELLATCSHDKTIKLWDTRSNIPLYTLNKHTAKLFALDWVASGDTLLSGGADAQLLTHVLSS